MIKSVIFDWGGVLIESPSKQIISYCAKYLNISHQKLFTTFLNLKPKFQTALISEDEFWNQICNEYNINKPTVKSLWKEAFKNSYIENKKVFSIAKSLKKEGFKIGFLSNTESPAVEFFHEQNYDFFDELVFSCNEGIRKPDHRIYKIIINNLENLPKESIFIDDQLENIIAARKIGIHTVHFKDFFSFKKELNGLLIKYNSDCEMN
jgi:putative hydrolase of the HAD superfamily